MSLSSTKYKIIWAKDTEKEWKREVLNLMNNYVLGKYDAKGWAKEVIKLQKRYGLGKDPSLNSLVKKNEQFNPITD
jgi:hypothetical protein